MADAKLPVTSANEEEWYHPQWLVHLHEILETGIVRMVQPSWIRSYIRDYRRNIPNPEVRTFCAPCRQAANIRKQFKDIAWQTQPPAKKT